jgi:phospholipase C
MHGPRDREDGSGGVDGGGFEGARGDGGGTESGVEDSGGAGGSSVSRRGLIAGAAVGAAALIGGSARRPTDAQARLIDTAVAASASGAASLSDVKHIVVLMQENRSFDHYFGTMSGVRGFSDPAVPTQTVNGAGYPVFSQFGFQPGTGASASGYIQPFRLISDPPLEDGQTTNDIDHSWAGQHHSWNGGKMDSFITSHLATDGATNGPVTMGYYTREDLAFYYALADAFTVCDAYHCSVLGPTDPNRLVLMSGTIDPEGAHGGPVVETFSNRLGEYGKLNWQVVLEHTLSNCALTCCVTGVSGLVACSGRAHGWD